MTTFCDDQDRATFLKLLGSTVARTGVSVHAYCLMPNHFHLLVTINERPLGPAMHRVLGLYARNFNGRYGRTGHLWQGRYRALLVEDGDYFLECSRYIHLNPVRAGMVGSPSRYDWSSFRAYSGLNTPLPWLTRTRTLDMFEAGSEYSAFVEEQDGVDCVDPFTRAGKTGILGSSSFVEHAARHRKWLPSQPRSGDPTCPPAKATLPVPIAGRTCP